MLLIVHLRFTERGSAARVSIAPTPQVPARLVSRIACPFQRKDADRTQSAAKSKSQPSPAIAQPAVLGEADAPADSHLIADLPDLDERRTANPGSRPALDR